MSAASAARISAAICAWRLPTYTYAASPFRKTSIARRCFGRGLDVPASQFCQVRCETPTSCAASVWLRWSASRRERRRLASGLTRNPIARNIHAMTTQSQARKKLAATNTRNLRTLLLLSVFAPKEIGARIATARRESGLTQEEAADLVGVSTRSWQGYEQGDVVPYRHMERISASLNRPVAWFLHGDEEVTASVEDRLDRIEEQLSEIRGLLARLAPPGLPQEFYSPTRDKTN